MIRGVPYDAEVEYLESTGTQWIDTLVNADSNMSVEITMANVGTSWNNTNPIGTIRPTPRYRHHLNFTPPGVRYFFGVGDGCSLISYVRPSDGDVFSYKVDAVNKTFSLGTYSGSFIDVTFDTGLSYWLFGRNGTTPPYLGSLRICSAKLWNGSTLVRNFIPVRFTNESGQSEGAMYDRVTRRLFRNQGTGAFQWGPDVATPVMALHMFQKPPLTTLDYVQDGLITHWDGIENVGRRVHSPNATVWKDLNGNYDLTIDDPNAYWTANSLSRDTLGANKVLAYYQSVIPNVVTLEICCLVTAEGSPSAFILTNGEVSYAEQQNVCINSRTNGVQTSFSRVWVNSVKTTGPYHVSARWDALYVDAIPVQAGWAQEAVTLGTNRFNVFGRAYSGTYNLAGNVHSIRLYNRALTAAEIAHNYAVDKERFKLP